jgi:ribosomal protein S18 acetylase RimI-like enzyme
MALTGRASVNSLSLMPTIRRAIPSDSRAVSALLRRSFKEFEARYTTDAFIATVQPENGILKRLDEGPLWVAENERGIVGTVSVVCATDSATVRGMAVDPEARGQKIGRALLCEAENFARERGLDRLFLYTTKFLLNAIGLYRSCGFEFTGETANPHGTELTRMVKSLKNEIKPPMHNETAIL